MTVFLFPADVFRLLFIQAFLRAAGHEKSTPPINQDFSTVCTDCTSAHDLITNL